MEAANKKSKKEKGMQIKPFHVKNHLSVFVNCLVENPAFDSQTKDTLTTRPKAFGSSAVLPDKMIKAVRWLGHSAWEWGVLSRGFVRRLPGCCLGACMLEPQPPPPLPFSLSTPTNPPLLSLPSPYSSQISKSGLLDRVLMRAKYKESSALTKKGGSKKAVILGIPKLDDANHAGSSKVMPQPQPHLASLFPLPSPPLCSLPTNVQARVTMSQQLLATCTCLCRCTVPAPFSCCRNCCRRRSAP